MKNLFVLTTFLAACIVSSFAVKPGPIIQGGVSGTIGTSSGSARSNTVNNQGPNNENDLGGPKNRIGDTVSSAPGPIVRQGSVSGSIGSSSGVAYGNSVTNGGGNNENDLGSPSNSIGNVA